MPTASIKYTAFISGLCLLICDELFSDSQTFVSILGLVLLVIGLYLISKGIKEWQISIDPGLGFGKTMRDSEILFKNLDVFCFDFPLVVGYSKKKFTENLNMTNNQLYQHCIDSGAALVRLHIAS